MKTIKIKVYKFKELSKEIKEKIIQSWRNEQSYPWEDENRAVLDEFEKIFPVKVGKWEYGYRNFIDFGLEYDYMSFNRDVLDSMKGLRLRKYILNNYYNYLYVHQFVKPLRRDDAFISHPRVKSQKLSNGKIYNSYRSAIYFEENCLTGYSAGYEILKPFIDFIKNPKKDVDFEDIIKECLESWLNYCKEDYEYWLSEEAIKEDIKINNYRFFKNGEIYIERRFN
ncbi:hypothetical protein M0R19_09315 [Candidatus Pacearchaeota archaeon]|nr:hypothetical protein [Candidatus Pacearchaeota archaeon]